MADIRTPEAWVNSARMSGGCYMYVEGSSDERFWKKFIDTNHVKVQVCHGCDMVEAVVDEHIKQGVDGFIGVIDSDFHALMGTTPHKRNLFVTDCHDIEMMMYHSHAYTELLNSIDRGNCIETYVASGNEPLRDTLEITDDIGCCKIATKKQNLPLVYKRENRRTHEIELPKYHDALDAAGVYQGIGQIIAKVNGFSNANLKKAQKEAAVAAARQEKDNNYNSWHLSNGHDVSYVLPYILRRKAHHKNQRMDGDYINSILYAAYTPDDFRATNLYNAMNGWAVQNGVHLFKI